MKLCTASHSRCYVTNTAAAVIYPLSLHDALPIYVQPYYRDADVVVVPIRAGGGTRIKVLEAFGYGRPVVSTSIGIRSEEHTSELQSRFDLVCRLLLEKKKVCPEPRHREQRIDGPT